MEIFNIHIFEFVLIAGIALIVFGPERLPEVGRFIGKQVARFLAWQQQSPELKMLNDIRGEFETEIANLRDELTRARNELNVQQEMQQEMAALRDELKPMLDLRNDINSPAGANLAPPAALDPAQPANGVDALNQIAPEIKPAGNAVPSAGRPNRIVAAEPTNVLQPPAPPAATTDAAVVEPPIDAVPEMIASGDSAEPELADAADEASAPQLDSPADEASTPQLDSPADEASTPQLDSPADEASTPQLDSPADEASAPQLDSPADEASAPQLDSPADEASAPQLDSPADEASAPQLDSPADGASAPQADHPLSPEASASGTPADAASASGDALLHRLDTLSGELHALVTLLRERGILDDDWQSAAVHDEESVA